ncbi:hypothetical protein BDQ12DRAFT_691607 [Crucibulum laeve]|uniref:Uncharacterized protein n=1 Tax=Crucibulum laeve TaxID=68775 RepID=A0A5C3LK53_9AGAR|nr:hypothetical protein BDQ12DRAFT_691607 [Crucibulum laeve]
MTTINTTPFFPDPTDVPTNDETKARGNLAKTVLEYLFLSVAIILTVFIIFRRCIVLKREKKPVTQFFNVDRNEDRRINSSRNFPRTTGLPPVQHDGSGPYAFYPSPYLTAVPTSYAGNGRRVRAFDIGEGGRRVGGGGDYDTLSDKDLLPAYDNIGGPPKYQELELQVCGGTRMGGDERAASTTETPAAVTLPIGGDAELRHEQIELASTLVPPGIDAREPHPSTLAHTAGSPAHTDSPSPS